MQRKTVGQISLLQYTHTQQCVCAKHYSFLVLPPRTIEISNLSYFVNHVLNSTSDFKSSLYFNISINTVTTHFDSYLKDFNSDCFWNSCTEVYWRRWMSQVKGRCVQTINNWPSHLYNERPVGFADLLQFSTNKPQKFSCRKIAHLGQKHVLTQIESIMSEAECRGDGGCVYICMSLVSKSIVND